MYTVIVGLIPALIRLLVWTLSQDRNMELLSAVDFVVFGLILHISIVNEIEHFNDSKRSWKTIQNGTSIAFITGYGALFTLLLLGQSNPGLIDPESIKYVAICFSVVSLVLSFSVYNRISKLDQVV